jgi:glycosyltransferase involved in cell wall biosynthesis
VLLSYAVTSAGMPENHPIFKYHPSPWMSNQILSLFVKRGYTVDCIHYTNRHFIPEKKYDIIFALKCNLLRLVSFAKQDSDNILKIWHPDISSLEHNNSTEIKRIHDLEKRRPGALYFPKRQEPYERIEKRVMELSDHCVFLGNKHVLDTFPKEFHHKFTAITVAATPVYVKQESEFVPKEREFLWHFGNGAVRKGLDLVLETFAKNPQWTLNVVGLVGNEHDFMKIYHKELTELPNIKFRGYMKPGSKEFADILKRCICFIAPSCTESISVACATMMQAGLYPLVSYDTGIELPEGSGIYLEKCSIDEIEKKVEQIYNMESAELTRQINKTQKFALKEYSREKFTEDMDNFLSKVAQI